jgi:hypothetical protein
MDLLEGLAQTVRHVDHHGLPVPDDIQLPANATPSTPLVRRKAAGTEDLERLDVANCGLHRSVDVEVLEVALELRVAILQIKESLQGHQITTGTSSLDESKREAVLEKEAGERGDFRDRRLADLRDGLLELVGLDALVLLDLPPGGVHLASLSPGPAAAKVGFEERVEIRNEQERGLAAGEEGERDKITLAREDEGAGKWRRRR